MLYVFADHLDADPWLLLQWRGRSREQLLEPIRARAGDDLGARDTGPVVAPWWPFGPLETLPVKTAAVVRSRDDEDHDVVVDPADPPTAVLRRCEALDVTVRDTEVSVLLTAAYEALASREL